MVTDQRPRRSFFELQMLPPERAVVSTLADNSDTDGICRLSVEFIAWDSLLSERAVQRALAAMKERGWIESVGGGQGVTPQALVLHLDRIPAKIPWPEYEAKLLEAARRAHVTKEMRQRVFTRDGYRCCQCGSEQQLTIDHVIPSKHGGDSSEGNLQTLCLPCNIRKGAKL